MYPNKPLSKGIIIAIILFVITASSIFAWYVHSITSQVEEALAAEVLEQQSDVAALIYDYTYLMFQLEHQRHNNSAESQADLTQALLSAQVQLELMRSNYSFARLDGAAKAHAYVKPVLEDIDQWLSKGIGNFPANDPVVLSIAEARLRDRYENLRDIDEETRHIAEELVEDQTNNLTGFNNSINLLFGGFGLAIITAILLLIYHFNIQARLAKEREDYAIRLIKAESRGRQQAEKALTRSEQFLRETLNALPLNVSIIDQDGLILEANTPWKQFIGNTDNPFSDGGIGYNFKDVLRSTLATESQENAINIATAQINAMLTGQRPEIPFEYPYQGSDGRRWALISLTKFTNTKKLQAILMLEDVTRRKELEERDRQLRAELAHASRLTTAGELASGLAHEINQPLTAISHNCDAALSQAQSQATPDVQLLNTLSDIYEQAHRAGGIVHSMRRFSRKDTAEKKSTDINKLVEETVRLTHPDAREKNVSVKLNLADNLAKPVIDPIQIQQVLVNLERNGVDALWQSNAEQRELIISTQMADDSTIQISVQDNGPGIDPEIKKSLFSAFKTTKADGMGLGLSISRTIVEEHGGRLWIDEDTTHATIFHFTIPITEMQILESQNNQLNTVLLNRSAKNAAG